MKSDIRLLINDLERLRKGDNVHTINVAIYWLRYLSNDPYLHARYIKNDNIRIPILNEHARKCRAVVKGLPSNTLYRSAEKLLKIAKKKYGVLN